MSRLAYRLKNNDELMNDIFLYLFRIFSLFI